MPNERQKLLVDAEYAAALGIALFAFATLELAATWCCEQMQPGGLDALEERTADRVADTLTHLARGLPSARGRDELVSASQRFQSLVQVRNSLFHARPMRVGATNVLARSGDPWTLSEITNAADQFTQCGEALNASLGSYLVLLLGNGRNLL